MQIRRYHPVRLRLPPLHRRGIVCLHRRGISWYRTHATTPSSFACHPSTGGELAGTEPTRSHPVKLRLPPLHRRGIVCLHRRGIGGWCRTHTTTPSGCACHPSTGGELAGAEPTQPPRQAAPDTPPQEGNTTPTNYHECFLCIIRE